jgi:hypothetical protein
MVSIVLLAMLPPAAAQSKPLDRRCDESEIKSLEVRRFQAMMAADLPALENLLSDDLVYTQASGWRQNKAEFLASIRTGEMQYHSITSVTLRCASTAAPRWSQAPLRSKRERKGKSSTSNSCIWRLS